MSHNRGSCHQEACSPSLVSDALLPAIKASIGEFSTQLDQSHSLVVIIRQQLDHPTPQSIGIILGKFELLQDVAIQGFKYLEKLQAAVQQSDARRKYLEVEGEDLAQLIKLKQTAHAAKKHESLSLKASIKHLDEPGRRDVYEQTLLRYKIQREYRKISRELGRTDFEWKRLERRETSWRSEYDAAVEENRKDHEALESFTENLENLHVEGSALSDDIEPLKRCTCGEECTVKHYDHANESNDE